MRLAGRVVGGLVGLVVGKLIVDKFKEQRAAAAVNELYRLLASKSDPGSLTAKEVCGGCICNLLHRGRYLRGVAAVHAEQCSTARRSAPLVRRRANAVIPRTQCPALVEQLEGGERAVNTHAGRGD